VAWPFLSPERGGQGAPHAGRERKMPTYTGARSSPLLQRTLVLLLIAFIGMSAFFAFVLLKVAARQQRIPSTPISAA